MANIIQIKHGATKPSTSSLQNFELGYCTADGLLYIGTPGGIKTVRSPLINKINSSDSTSAVNSIAIINYSVPLTRTINNKALSSDIVLSAVDVGARANTWMPSATDVGAVPTSRTINEKALSANISLTAADVGAVPTSRTVNNKALSANITINAADVGARADTWLPSLSDLEISFVTEGKIKYTDIPNGANLNDYHAPGFYRSTSSSNSSITNKPGNCGYAFELVVTGISDYSYCTQWVKDFSNNRVFMRTQTSWQSPYNNWTDWFEFYTTSYEPTPAAIGAAARNKSTVSVTANSAISLSLADGEMAYLGYTTSATSNADISLLVNGSQPATKSYTYTGTSNNYNTNIFARAGGSHKGTFSGWISVHGDRVEVRGSGVRGSDSGGNMGQIHMSWNLSSVSSITISAAGSLTITKLS